MSQENIESNENGICENEVDQQIQKRPRSPTLLKLKMFAEGFRKRRAVEEKIAKGEYRVSSEDIAKALLEK